MLDKLIITVTKTARGEADYCQIASPAAVPVNIVLIANEIAVEDHRGKLAEPVDPAETKYYAGLVKKLVSEIRKHTPEVSVIKRWVAEAEKKADEVLKGKEQT